MVKEEFLATSWLMLVVHRLCSSVNIAKQPNCVSEVVHYNFGMSTIILFPQILSKFQSLRAFSPYLLRFNCKPVNQLLPFQPNSY